MVSQFGIEQIDIDDLPDTEDFSVHKVCYGNKWQDNLSQYTRNCRGPIKSFSDKIVSQYEFDETYIYVY